MHTCLESGISALVSEIKIIHKLSVFICYLLFIGNNNHSVLTIQHDLISECPHLGIPLFLFIYNEPEY